LIGIAMIIGLLATEAYVNPSNSDQRTDFLQTVAQIAGGLALGLGLVYTARNYQLNREGQITERFTRAVEQLGSEKPEIRIGGIYALERIASESDSHYEQAIWTLAEYVQLVRPSFRWPQGSSSEDERYQEPFSPFDIFPPHEILIEKPDLPTDIQLIVRVISRRRKGTDTGERVQLAFRDIDLRQADFRFSELTAAAFLTCDQRNAWFAGGKLSRSQLLRCHLDDAVFTGADLTRAFIQHCTLRMAMLSNVRAQNANFYGTDLSRCMAWEANLEGATIAYAKADDASFLQANLTMTDFTGTTLSRASFKQATTHTTNFCGIDLSSVRDLTRAQYDQAQTDSKTIPPLSFAEPPSE
jgi:uncharacterized protein YjbI with pentapeptide repeats